MPMTTKDFLRQVAELVRFQVPPGFQEFETVGPWGGLVKFHFGEPRIHYEVWVQRRHKVVELGLHFESKPETNIHYLKELTAHFEDIRSALGQQVEAEQWTSRWTRIHQSIALETLDEDLMWEVASQASRMIGVLEPLVREASKTIKVPADF